MDTIELARRLRLHSVRMTHASRASHVGSALSIADIVAVLYGKVMRLFPNDPLNDKRDRFVLSKGHAGMCVYAALAEVGFFSTSVLDTYYMDGSSLSGHISHKGVPGVEFSTGSLGHGISYAAGLAMAAKLDGKRHRVFAVAGDGECDEGSVWEAVLFANHHRLSNLTVIIDHNKLQSLDTCENTMELLDLKGKFLDFGWDAERIDGHDHAAISMALVEREEAVKPLCIIADTVKGKGVSFMENQVLWHYRDPQGEFYERAVLELGGEP